MRWLDSMTNPREHELKQSPGDTEGKGSLACCSPGGGGRVAHHKESDMTEKLNNNNKFSRKIMKTLLQVCSLQRRR